MDLQERQPVSDNEQKNNTDLSQPSNKLDSTNKETSKPGSPNLPRHNLDALDSDEVKVKDGVHQGPQFNSLDKCPGKTSESGQELNKSRLDTLSTDQNEDVYIDKYGNILRGQAATVEKAFREIEKKYSRRFTIKLKQPDCESQTNKEDDSHQETGDNSEEKNAALPQHSSTSIQSSDGSEQDVNSHHTRGHSLSPSECNTNECQLQNDLETDLVECTKTKNMDDLQPGVDSASHGHTLDGQRDTDLPQMIPREDITNECQRQNDLETGMREYSKDGSMDSHLIVEVDSDIDEDDSASTDEMIQHTPTDSDSDYSFNIVYAQDIDCHIDLVQEENDSEEENGSEEEHGREEVNIDVHCSLQQEFITQPKVIKKVNEHTVSRVSSSREVLKKTSSKVAAEVTALSTDRKVVNEKFQCLSSDTKIKGSEVSAATADMKLVDTKVQTGTVVNKVEGAEIKIASGSAKGLSVQAGAQISTTTKGLTTTAGKVDLTGADVDVRATAEQTAQGVSCNTGTATVIGVQEKAKAAAKVTTSAAKVQAGVATATGMKSGVTAEASAEVTGLDITAGTAQLSGGELSAVASATASAGTKLSVANFRATGLDGVGVRASVEASSGLDLFSVTAGISGTTGVSLSTTPKVGCVSLTPEIPKLGRGIGFLSFGLGGGIGGESGTYAGVATIKNSNRSSAHGNEYGGGGGDCQGQESGGDSQGGIGGDGQGGIGGDGQGGIGGDGQGGIGGDGQGGIGGDGQGGIGGDGQGGIGGDGQGGIGGDGQGEIGGDGQGEIGGDSQGQKSGGNGQGHGGVLGSNFASKTSELSPVHESIKPELGNVSETSALSVVQGSTKGTSESLHLNGVISGQATLGNTGSIKIHHPSNHDDNSMCTNTMPQSHGQHGDSAKVIRGDNADRRKPFHLRALHDIEQHHFFKGADKLKKTQPSGGQASGHASMPGQVSDCGIQLQGPEAVKLNAMINEHYPLLPGEIRSDSVSSKPLKPCDIERVKRSAMKRLSNRGKMETQGSDPSLATPNNPSTNQHTAKKVKPFGSRNHIHTLADCFSDNSSKDIIKSGKFAEFKDPDC